MTGQDSLGSDVSSVSDKDADLEKADFPTDFIIPTFSEAFGGALDHQERSLGLHPGLRPYAPQMQSAGDGPDCEAPNYHVPYPKVLSRDASLSSQHSGTVPTPTYAALPKSDRWVIE